MGRLTAQEIAAMFLALGTLLGTARLLGEAFRRLRQPAVVGEILAGVILGPTVMGRISPEAVHALFPSGGTQGLLINGLALLGVTLFLLVAGMEVDLSTLWRQGRAALIVALAGMVFPFALGFLGAEAVPSFMGREPGPDGPAFALFFGIALSISALPVIAKVLMDLDLYRTDLGMIVVAAAIFNDLVGWIAFAAILGMMGSGPAHGLHAGHTLWMTIVFVAGMLTVGRIAINRALPWLQSHASWPGGVLGFALSLTLLCAAFTEWAGIHAVFGAFIFGVALGDSSHLREETRLTMDRFISFFFAPLFFASIGLKVDFAASFDLPLVLAVTAVACCGKVLGCGLGGRWGGLPWREAWAVGFGLNARGGMQIVLGLLALEYGLIGERLFVALVVMALATTVMSGPVMQALLKGKRKTLRLADCVSPLRCAWDLDVPDRWEAIRVLSAATASGEGLDAEAVYAAVAAREKVMSTGLPNGIATPHARLAGIKTPLVAVGASREGIDFDTPDGFPVHLVFLILSPEKDAGVQLEVLADIARLFRDPGEVASCLACGGFDEFADWLKEREGENAAPSRAS